MIFIKFPDKNSIKKITSTDNFQNTVSNVADEIIDKAEQYVSQTVDDFKNKIFETVSNISDEISAMENERRRKNLETMNQIRFNSIHLSDSQLRTFINDKSLDKFKRIGYSAAFADRYLDKRD